MKYRKTGHKGTFFSLDKRFKFCGKELSFEHPLIMGILNITHDSFYDGGMYSSDSEYLNRIEIMIREGAAIVDIGAISTRPGAHQLPVADELKRIDPVVQGVRKNFPEIIISVDTYRSEVAKSVIELGADMINDISGGTFDKNMFNTIIDLDIPYVMMHIQGTPENMQKHPTYDNVVDEISGFFEKQISELKSRGFEKIILDPGFGFGKNLEHNYSLLASIKEFHRFGYPVMAGLSRKSMINKILRIGPEDALNGTTVLNTIALLSGANILRVHDVKEAMETILLCREIFKNNGSIKDNL